MKWSKSVLEAFITMLFTNLGEDTLFGYKNLPKYRVLRKYKEQGIADITMEPF